MVNIGIQIKLIIIFFLFSGSCVAQQNITKKITGHLYNIEEDTVKAYEGDSALFILITNKNCVRCFQDLCAYIDNHYRNYKLNGIIMMPKNYLELNPAKQRYYEEIKCLQAFYFYFIKADMGNEIKAICESPSPQLILKTGKNYQYLSYAAILKMSENK
jgi:hypothetical protein